MTNEIESKLKKCKSFSDMLDVIKSNYIIKKEIGLISKKLIVAGLNSRLEKKLDNDTIKKIYDCNTMGDMIASFEIAYKGLQVEHKHQANVIYGLSQILTMTGLQLKK